MSILQYNLIFIFQITLVTDTLEFISEPKPDRLERKLRMYILYEILDSNIWVHVLELRDEESSEPPSLLEHEIIQIKVFTANERTRYLVYIPPGQVVTAEDLLEACKLKFNNQELKLFYNNGQIPADMGMILDPETSFVISEMPENEDDEEDEDSSEDESSPWKREE